MKLNTPRRKARNGIGAFRDGREKEKSKLQGWDTRLPTWPTPRIYSPRIAPVADCIGCTCVYIYIIYICVYVCARELANRVTGVRNALARAYTLK